MNTNTALSQNQPVEPLSTYYRSIDNLPLSLFKQVYVNQNYAALVISGFPDPQDLVDSWEAIRQEFSEYIGDEEYGMYLRLYADVCLLQTEYENVDKVIGIMRTAFSDDVKELHPEVMEMIQLYAEFLNTTLMQNIRFDYIDPIKYNKQLDRCVALNEFLEVKLTFKNEQLEAISDKYNKEGTKPTMAFFQSYLIALSNFHQYHISDNITTLEYCMRIKDYNEARNKINLQNAARQSR